MEFAPLSHMLKSGFFFIHGFFIATSPAGTNCKAPRAAITPNGVVGQEPGRSLAEIRQDVGFRHTGRRQLRDTSLQNEPARRPYRVPDPVGEIIRRLAPVPGSDGPGQRHFTLFAATDSPVALVARERPADKARLQEAAFAGN